MRVAPVPLEIPPPDNAAVLWSTSTLFSDSHPSFSIPPPLTPTPFTIDRLLMVQLQPCAMEKIPKLPVPAAVLRATTVLVIPVPVIVTLFEIVGNANASDTVPVNAG